MIFGLFNVELLHTLFQTSNFHKEKVEIGYCKDELKRCESRLCPFCSENWIPREEIIELKTEYNKKLEIRA